MCTQNSYKYFENRDCKYYPCHKDIDNINCLFCYCPMYSIKECPGNPSFVQKSDGIRKVCTGCDFPHREENYDKIMAVLKEYNSQREW